MSTSRPSRSLFLSTPSVRRATAECGRAVQRGTISIHALREEGDFHDSPKSKDGALISIHALREEGDFIPLMKTILLKRFLSTPSARRATESGSALS